MKGYGLVFNSGAFLGAHPHAQYTINDLSKKPTPLVGVGGNGIVLIPHFSDVGPDNVLFRNLDLPAAYSLYGDVNIKKNGLTLQSGYMALGEGAIGVMCRLADKHAGYALKYLDLELAPAEPTVVDLGGGGAGLAPIATGIGISAQGYIVPKEILNSSGMLVANPDAVIVLGEEEYDPESSSPINNGIPSKVYATMKFRDTVSSPLNKNLPGEGLASGNRAIISEDEMELEMTAAAACSKEDGELYKMNIPLFALRSYGRGRYGNKTSFIITPNNRKIDGNMVYTLEEYYITSKINQYNFVMEDDVYYNAAPISLEDKLANENALYVRANRSNFLDQSTDSFHNLLDVLVNKAISTSLPSTAKEVEALTAFIENIEDMKAYMDENDNKVITLFDFYKKEIREEYPVIAEWINVGDDSVFSTKTSLKNGYDGAMEAYRKYDTSEASDNMVHINAFSDHIISHEIWSTLPSEINNSPDAYYGNKEDYETYNPFVKALKDFYDCITVPEIADIILNNADVIIDPDYPLAVKRSISEFTTHGSGKRGDITAFINFPSTITTVSEINTIHDAFNPKNMQLKKFPENCLWLDDNQKPHRVAITMLAQSAVWGWFDGGMKEAIAGREFDGVVKGSIRPLITEFAVKSSLAEKDLNMILETESSNIIFGQQGSYTGVNSVLKEAHNSIIFGRIIKRTHMSVMRILHKLTTDSNLDEAKRYLSEEIDEFRGILGTSIDITPSWLDKADGQMQIVIDLGMNGTTRKVAIVYNVSRNES